jgi:hypothetical protein
MPGHKSPPRTPALPGLRNFRAAQSAPRARAMELALKAIGSNPREPCSSAPHPWRNLNPQESEERAHARAPGWAAASFVLPRKTIEGLTLLTKSVANRERTLRSEEPHGFRRRNPKTRNFHVIRALNYLLQERGLSQFCVEETEPCLVARVGSLSLRQDLRTVIRKCRPDWDLTPPELKSAWEHGGKETVLSLQENVHPNHRRKGLDSSYD